MSAVERNDERSKELYDTDVLEELDVHMIVDDVEEVDLDDPEYQPDENNSSTRTHTNNNAIPNITLLPVVRPSTAEPAIEAGLAPANKGGNGEMQAEGNPCQGSPLPNITNKIVIRYYIIPLRLCSQFITQRTAERIKREKPEVQY